MSIRTELAELAELVDGLDEGDHDWRTVRAIKLIARHLAKEAEATA